MTNLNDLNLEGYLNGSIPMPTSDSTAFTGRIITDEEWKKRNEEVKKKKEETPTEEAPKEEPKAEPAAEKSKQMGIMLVIIK